MWPALIVIFIIWLILQSRNYEDTLQEGKEVRKDYQALIDGYKSLGISIRSNSNRKSLRSLPSNRGMWYHLKLVFAE